ncbi:hypothetical protein E2C01_023997 [Portunus trituberculatus]|uniref:Uncharacterized protein n=1 Tax=Portunus trituberculatus TaxID=210409 RepID=A0A5B7EAR2_PORTR|nr:hypothetical protein [Portunus trituberculatus]
MCVCGGARRDGAGQGGAGAWRSRDGGREWSGMILLLTLNVASTEIRSLGEERKELKEGKGSPRLCYDDARPVPRLTTARESQSAPHSFAPR